MKNDVIDIKAAMTYIDITFCPNETTAKLCQSIFQYWNNHCIGQNGIPVYTYLREMLAPIGFDYKHADAILEHAIKTIDMPVGVIAIHNTPDTPDTPETDHTEHIVCNYIMCNSGEDMVNAYRKALEDGIDIGQIYPYVANGHMDIIDKLGAISEEHYGARYSVYTLTLDTYLSMKK